MHETGTGQQVAQFYERLMMMMMIDEIKIGIIKYRQFTYNLTLRLGRVTIEPWKSKKYYIY